MVKLHADANLFFLFGHHAKRMLAPQVHSVTQFSHSVSVMVVGGRGIEY